MSAMAHFEIAEELPHLKRFAFSLTHTRDSAEDLVQDCVERALIYKHKFKAGTNLRAWLFRMMRNLHINGRRRARLERNYLDGEKVKDEYYSSANQMHALQLQDLKEAFKQLPMAERAALLLVTLKGLSYQQAAKQLECQEGTVKSRVFRARKKLAKLEIY